MALGVIAYGTSMVAFIDARATGRDMTPTFDDSAHKRCPNRGTGNIVTKRFVFTDQKTAELKKRSLSASTTRVEAVSAGIGEIPNRKAAVIIRTR